MDFLHRTVRLLRAINSQVLRLFTYAGVGLIACMTLVILLQVVFRYFLNSALPWPEELARFQMVWLTFLIAPYAYEKKLNIGVEVLVGKATGNLAKVIAVGIHSLILVLSILLCIEGVQMVDRGFAFQASSMDFSLAFVYLAIPVSFASMVLVAFEKIFREFVDV